MPMRSARPNRWYRPDLKPRARLLRRDPTPAERKLWYEFLSSHHEKFTRQKPIGNYIADFYCAQKRLVIEVDGDSHFSDQGQHHDAKRTRALGSDGIRVLRFTNAEVAEQFEAVCERIEEALSRASEKT